MVNIVSVNDVESGNIIRNKSFAESAGWKWKKVNGMDELKRCPFCNGEAKLVGYGLTGVMKVVQCLDCGARTRAFDPKIKRGENAIDAWNRRVRDDTGRSD